MSKEPELTSRAPFSFSPSLAPVHLNLPLVSQPLHIDRRLLDQLLVPIRTDNILEVLEQPFLVLSRSLRLHLRDRLDLALEDQEPVVGQVDPPPEQEALLPLTVYRVVLSRRTVRATTIPEFGTTFQSSTESACRYFALD